MFQSFEPTSDIGFARRNLPKLRGVLSRHDLDGYLVPHDDEYQNEYLPAYAERLMWVSGFSGSAGFAVILPEKAGIFSDGRYTLQLRDQVDGEFFSFHQTSEDSPAEWLARNGVGLRVGYDPATFTESSLRPFQKIADAADITLAPTTENLIDLAWSDQADKPKTPITPHPVSLAGKPSSEKRASIAEQMRDQGVDAALIATPSSLAWLFNIRGNDVHASPLPLGRAILYADGRANLFVDLEKITPDVTDHLGPEVTVCPEETVAETLKKLGAQKKGVSVDPNTTPVSFIDILQTSGATLVRLPDPCALPRATKTDAELNGTRTAHHRDGVAVTRFLHWLDQTAPSGGVTEIAAAKKLEAFRAETGAMKDVSFDTISGAGAHGAVVHYRVTTKTDAEILENSLFLIDSGAQYVDGTTDITRTIAIGTPTQEMRNRYTLVLKGHIAIATARFPTGTSGHQLDAFARRPLWDAGLDYDHGTGHGVGSYLGVHEGPQNISKKLIPQALMPGMICSNEPGYYKTGEFGIRIENLVIVSPPAPIPGGERSMLGFETITLAPLDRRLIDSSLLTEDERRWIDAYHERVRRELSAELDDDTRKWLENQTAPLSI